ncbi:hypothetical protein [Anaerovirgula multivorans]|uniref:hypothetical protein n=1 Tax=Anaerovirgula multivorans TaxID=312168 RepID=UPI000B777FC8|nr:hypothetical protein [Anaerovirgula multivorans]
MLNQNKWLNIYTYLIYDTEEKKRPTGISTNMVNLVFKSMQNVLEEGTLVSEKPALGGEEFASIHNPKFNPDENALAIGIQIMVQVALNFCKPIKDLSSLERNPKG